MQLLLMLGADGDGDTAANAELGHDFAPARVKRRQQVIQDDVSDVLVEDTLVAIRPQVKL